MTESRLNKSLAIVAALSFIAMGLTVYLTYMHYVPDAADVCNISTTWNCDIVNKSQWSYIDVGFTEIPVAIMGFFTYLAFFLFSVLYISGVNFKKILRLKSDKIFFKLFKYLSIIGVLFSLYLSYIEAFKLFTFCLFCVTQQVIIFILMIIFFVIDAQYEQTK